MSETPNVRTEWGVRLTWPDGFSEVRTHGTGSSEPVYGRRDAEIVARETNVRREDGETEATAEVVTRTIETASWMEVEDLVLAHKEDDNNIDIEWGRRLTWPDGHVEVDECYDRNHAETKFRMAKDGLDHKETTAVPEKVGRYVTTTEWRAVMGPRIDQVMRTHGFKTEG